MRFNQYFFCKNIFTFFCIFYSTVAYPEIIIHGTRVIYPSDAKDVTIQLSNRGDRPSLVQVWIDRGDTQLAPEHIKVPFVILPPIMRVEAEKGQVLRVTALPAAKLLSQNQETLFWLNVLDIPPKPSLSTQTEVPDNFLQLAIRSRIKFFFRPHMIDADATDAWAKLKWTTQADNLIIENPTAFYISITSIEQTVSGQKVNIIENGMMLEPFSKQNAKLKSMQLDNMKFVIINDFGSRILNDLKF